jgi:hypothetical protein
MAAACVRSGFTMAQSVLAFPPIKITRLKRPDEIIEEI